MIHIVAAIYITLGFLLLLLTNFVNFGGAAWYESLGSFFIFIGLVLHVVGVVKWWNHHRSSDVQK